MAKLLPGFLLLVFTVSVSSSDFSFAPSTAQAIAKEKTKSYHFLRLTKKSDGASQVRYLFWATAVMHQGPDNLAYSLLPHASFVLDDFVLSFLTLDIPPPRLG